MGERAFFAPVFSRELKMQVNSSAKTSVIAFEPCFGVRYSGGERRTSDFSYFESRLPSLALTYVGFLSYYGLHHLAYGPNVAAQTKRSDEKVRRLEF